jgi:hypothetical protein
VKSTSARPRAAASPDAPGGDGTTPSTGGALTTGRFLVVYTDAVIRSPKAAEKSLRDTAGIKNVISAADYRGGSVKAEDAQAADATYFPALGIAVVSADDDQLQSLMSVAADDSSNILAVEPEYVYHAIADLSQQPLEYLRG